MNKYVIAAIALSLGAAGAARAEFCPDSDALILVHDVERTRPQNGSAQLQVNIAGSGGLEKGEQLYNALIASDAFTPVGALRGFEPIRVAAPLSEWIDELGAGWHLWSADMRIKAQIVSCPRAKSWDAEVWRRLCADDFTFPLSAFLLSGARVTPLDARRLPLDPNTCSLPR